MPCRYEGIKIDRYFLTSHMVDMAFRGKKGPKGPPKPRFETLQPLIVKHGAKAGEQASVMTMNIYKYNLDKLAAEGFDTKDKLLADPKKVIEVVDRLTDGTTPVQALKDKRRKFYSSIFWPLSDVPDNDPKKLQYREAFRANMRDYSSATGEAYKPAEVPAEPKMSFPSKDPVYFLSTRSKKTHVWELKSKTKAGYRTAVPIAKIDLTEKKPKCEPITSDKETRVRFPGKLLYSGLELQLSYCSNSLEDFYPVTTEYARNTKILLLDGKELTNICNTTV